MGREFAEHASRPLETERRQRRHINLDGSGVNTSYIAIDSYAVEIPPGGSLHPEQYLYDELLFVLKGNGATAVWTAETKKQTFEWQEGSLFTIPLNAAHQLFNGDGKEPALLLGFTFAPTMINLLHNEEFIFNNPFAFTDRYRGETDYFQGPAKVLGKDWLDTNFIRDVRTFAMGKPTPNNRSDSRDEPALLYIEMGCNTMSAHIMGFPVGTYAKAHRHEPGAHILILSGHGYSLHWVENEEPVRIDWQPGSLFAPPGAMVSSTLQHRAEPGEVHRFQAAQPEIPHQGKIYEQCEPQAGRHNDRVRQDENPAIRAQYERECARNGVQVNMRPVEAD